MQKRLEGWDPFFPARLVENTPAVSVRGVGTSQLRSLYVGLLCPHHRDLRLRCDRRLVC